MGIPVTIPQAYDCCEHILKSGLVPFMSGKPGIGKSAISKQLAERFNLELIDIRLAGYEPTDMTGLPNFNKERERASYWPMDIFPLEGDPLPKGKNGWLVFLDELPSAGANVQKAAYKFVLDRMVGEKHLHSKVGIISAGNRIEDAALVEEMSSALSSRLIHINVESDLESWQAWAAANNVDYRITAFIRFKPELLNNFDPNVYAAEPVFACERSWDFLNSLVANLDLESPIALPTLSGAVGQGPAHEFLMYSRIFDELPKMADILSKPNSTEVPTSPGVLFGLCGSLAEHAREDIISQMMHYIERIPLEFQIVCLQEMGRRRRELLQDPVVQTWISRNKNDLN